MFFVDEIRKEFGMDEIDIFVDMDGVIAEYVVGSYDFAERRALSSNIRVLGRLANFENVTMHILSICHSKKDINDKNEWLNKYAPYFKANNRHIIAKEKRKISSKELKLNFLQEHFKQNKKKIILIDDDNEIIKCIKDNLPDVTVYQDSSLVD